MPDRCDPISGDMIAYGLRERVVYLEARIRAMCQWLEIAQPDVFSRGLWDTVNAAVKNLPTGLEDAHDYERARVQMLALICRIAKELPPGACSEATRSSIDGVVAGRDGSKHPRST